MPQPPLSTAERQLTDAPYGHILTNIGVWSPDSRWIVYDTRSDAAGSNFDGNRIEAVEVDTGEIKVLYEARNGAHCGVATWHPRQRKVVFILGPENPTADYRYGPSRRQGVIVDADHPGGCVNLDARDLVPPFTPGALRGGSHVHVFSPDGQLVSFTYDDDLVDREAGERNVGVAITGHPVGVPTSHARNHSGEAFSVLVTRTTTHPKPGSDEISRAFEDAWVGTNGYLKADGTRQRQAIAFQGQVISKSGETVAEVFISDLSADLTVADSSPLQGTETTRPAPPRGVAQRRLTFTTGRKYPGIQGPRHWLRSSPDGSRIAFLMKDDAGVVQVFTVSPNGGEPQQLTRNGQSISSAFTWSPDGRSIAHTMDGSLCITDTSTGLTTRLTVTSSEDTSPRPEAVVFSPDGRKVAYVRPVTTGGGVYNQIFMLPLSPSPVRASSPRSADALPAPR